MRPLPSQTLWLTLRSWSPLSTLTSWVSVCRLAHLHISKSHPPGPRPDTSPLSGEHTRKLTWSSKHNPPASGTVAPLSRAQAHSTSRLSPFRVPRGQTLLNPFATSSQLRRTQTWATRPHRPGTLEEPSGRLSSKGALPLNPRSLVPHPPDYLPALALLHPWVLCTSFPQSRRLSTVLPSGLRDTPAQALPALLLMWHTRCLHIHSLPPQTRTGASFTTAVF